MKRPKGIDPEVWAKFEAGREERSRLLVERIVRMEEEQEAKRRAAEEEAARPRRRRLFGLL